MAASMSASPAPEPTPTAFSPSKAVQQDTTPCPCRRQHDCQEVDPHSPAPGPGGGSPLRPDFSPSRPIAGDLVRHLHFYSPPPNDEKPVFVVTEPNGVGFKNYPCVHRPTLIRDVRSHPTRQSFDLSRESFQLLRRLPAPESVDVSSDAAVRAAYVPSAVGIVKAHVPGVQHVVVFDHTIRRASASLQLNRPVKKVHVDQTPKAALMRADRHLSREQAAAVRRGDLRLRILNVWRPLRGPIADHPLCLAESSSVAEEDLVEVDHAYADRVGQTYAVRYRGPEAHRFWYLSGMEATDAWLIQCFDSQRNDAGELRRCVHASFDVREAQNGGGSGSRVTSNVNGDGLEGRERESIEVRCLVLGPNTAEE